MRRVLRCQLILALGLLLCACGGGTGGGSDSSATAPVAPSGPDRNAMLYMDASMIGSTVYTVPIEGMQALELPLRVALSATNNVAILARNGTLQFKVGDSYNSTQYTLIDADSNRVPSAGDTVVIEYRAGSLVGLLQALTIRLTSVDDALGGVMSGTVD